MFRRLGEAFPERADSTIDEKPIESVLTRQGVILQKFQPQHTNKLQKNQKWLIQRFIIPIKLIRIQLHGMRPLLVLNKIPARRFIIK